MATPGETPTLRALLDSGAPENSSDYTTLVVVHGLMWHGASFKKLLPLAVRHNARVIALNRRDYPGSTPYTAAERTLLARVTAKPPTADAHAETWAFVRERARELYEYLIDLIRRERIPPARGGGVDARGGIVLAGWSLGGVFMTAFLAHAPTFRSDDVQLTEYLRRVVHYDCPVGFDAPQIPNEYFPSQDPALSLAERQARFHEWAGGYYAHGEPIAPETLSMREALRDPAPTARNMSAAERAECLYEEPGVPGGSDTVFLRACGMNGVHGRLREAAFFLHGDGAEGDGPSVGRWRALEVRIVWCDRSMWSAVWAARTISAEMEGAREAGKAMRNIEIVRFRGANHFAHWDLPEETLRIFLTAAGGAQVKL